MKKRFFAAFIAFIMVMCSFAPVSTFAKPSDEFPYFPYLDEDGYYYRIYDGNKKSFNTHWDSIVDYVATEIKACRKSITFDYATADEGYAYIYNSKRNNSSESGDFIYDDLMAELAQIMDTDSFTIGAHSTTGYLNDGDYPDPNSNMKQYYPFTITLSSISYPNVSDDTSLYPMTSEGKYYRISDNAPAAFNTDWDEMIDYFQKGMINRRNSLTYYFATTDEKYAYTDDTQSSNEVCNQFVKDVLTDVYKKDSDNPNNAGGGDYLFKSVKYVGSHGYKTFSSTYDTPAEGEQRYYTFKITLGNIAYFTTLEQEETVRVYCMDFSERFIDEGASDYDKVKTIYDFVVRNTKYDDEVFKDREKYPYSSDRYTIAHSAYGALRGNLEEGELYDWSREKSVSGLTHIEKCDQGLAVCEGYSKLFYYLCVMNSIPCRIVDGDYVEGSGKSSDAHEWNYVWLDDGCGDGYKWFEVDTTFGAQKSFKNVGLNDYNYFLCGRENINFGWRNHQQPFHISDDHLEGEEYDILKANVIYDYWGDNEDKTYVSSEKDYQFKKLDFSNIDVLESGYVVRRSTDYAGDDDTKVALIQATKDDQYIVNIDDDGNFLPTEIHGFIYNGQPQSVYDVIIPYLDIREYDVQSMSNLVNVGEYTLDIYGANDTSAKVSFNILPMDLNGNRDDPIPNEHYDNETLTIQENAVYTGSEILPNAYIADGYKNVLVEGEDYQIDVYSDPNHTQKTIIKDIGIYYVDINYDIGKKNYTGHYYFTFRVGKIGMDQVNINDFEFPYVPKPLREKSNIKSPTDLYKSGALNMRIGEHNVVVDADYSVSSNGMLSWGASGNLILTGLDSSNVIVAGSTKTVQYHVSQKFDITKQGLDNKYADSGRTNIYTYTGRAIEPGIFDNLDGYLEQGTDYVIDSYSNNTNAGQANVVIKGVNGCTGSVTMHFYINKASITNAKLVTNVVNGAVVCSLSFNGINLVKNKDYTETTTEIDPRTGEKKSGYYFIVISGINNFNGSTVIDVKSATIAPAPIAPTASGNYATISASAYTYDGKPKKPVVKVYNQKKQAINAQFYTYTYSANVNPGTAKVTITFRNGYKGTIVKTFVIYPREQLFQALRKRRRH